MIDIETAATLEALAERVARILPMSSRDPHAFYEQRSEVASEIRAIADRLRNRCAPVVSVPAPIGRQGSKSQTMHVGGRTFQVLRRKAV